VAGGSKVFSVNGSQLLWEEAVFGQFFGVFVRSVHYFHDCPHKSERNPEKKESPAENRLTFAMSKGTKSVSDDIMYNNKK
jgi:hypothetical protein